MKMYLFNVLIIFTIIFVVRNNVFTFRLFKGKLVCPLIWNNDYYSISYL